MIHTIRAQERRLAELKKEVTKRGADRYASRLSNGCELPADLQSPSVAILTGREVIQDIIVFPPQIQRGWHYVPRQALLFTKAGVIHLLASIWPEQEPQITHLNGSGLMYLKATLMLLYGHLEIVAQSEDSLVRLGLEFNTVSWNTISIPLRRFLGLSKTKFNVPTDQISYSPSARQAFEKLPYKFFNGVQIYGLLPGEELEALAFQESSWKRWFHFLRRPKTADTLLMLSTNYMVVIQEDLRVRQGWIITYIPRTGICGIQDRVQDNGLWTELSVRLERQDQITDWKLLLTKQSVDAWRTQWTAHGGHWQDLSNT
jgi:hypothetical protein